MIKNFSLLKNEKQRDNQPDYRITIRNDNDFVEAGACWLKVGKNGQKYLSCKLRDKYEDKPGYEIVQEQSELNTDKPYETDDNL